MALMALLNHPNYNGSDRLIPSDHFYTFFSGVKIRQSIAKLTTAQGGSSTNAYFIKAANKLDQV
jgi:hypothetical protein